VVTHPTYGLLILEVKGGREIRHSNGREWTSVRHDTGKESTMKKSPFQQASDNMHTLKKKITKRVGRIPFAYGYACIFPGTDRIEGQMPGGVEKELIMTGRDQAEVKRAVDAAFGVWRGKPDRNDGAQDKKAEFLKRVHREVLQPEFRVLQTLRTQIRDAEEAFARMTKEQALLFNGFLKANNRALIKGYAGTGKTFLAAHRAAELGREGKETLLLCYNRHLADHLDRKMEGVPNVKVATFHQLADEWQDLAPDYSFPENPDSDFWNEGAADLLLNAVEYGGKQFDAILVDEAQDFKEYWWLPVEAMLRSDAHFYVFMDPGQNIYEGDVKALLDLPTSVPLRKNCRSTKHISRFAAKVARRDEGVSPEHVGEGVEVRQHAFGDRSDQVDIVEEIIRDLKEEESLSSSDIVLLSPRSYRSCILAHTSYEIAGHQVKPFELAEPSEDTLYYDSVAGFKGMEAPVVVLFDVLEDHVSSSDTNVYVGSTRARHLLHVVHERGWSPEPEEA